MGVDIEISDNYDIGRIGESNKNNKRAVEAHLEVQRQLERKKKAKKVQKTMRVLLNQLKTLKKYDISLKVYKEENPLSKIPFSRPFSKEFFTAVKLKEELKVKKFLINDRFLIYCVDSVSLKFLSNPNTFNRLIKQLYIGLL
jgi:hypothetical protein